MAEWLVGFITQHGYLGIAALMLLENVFPPIPSELIMPFAGFAAAAGKLNVLGVVAAGTAGSIAGTLPWYVAARMVTAEQLEAWVGRHGRWLTVSPQEVERARRWFERRGAMAVILGRLVPAVRSVISAPAGLARMPLLKFLLCSALGSVVWVGALTALGWALQDRYREVGHWIDPVAKTLLAGAVLAYVWRVLRFKRERK